MKVLSQRHLFAAQYVDVEAFTTNIRMHILYTLIYSFPRKSIQENLFISLTLITRIFDSVLILKRQIRC